ncbi:MAG: Gfo/Idh/MocA family oxidoreductase [Cohaesibacter sp.]|jgi:predicted dehydrogenase|nr:Gfo/Idh/MocA family oxidoreductase [Cohaesibacter sp.]
MVKILVCGYGSIGKKHTANLKKMGAEIRVWRQRKEAAADILADGYVFQENLEQGIDWCDGVVIATTTNQHIGPANLAATEGKAIYLEKPLSHNRVGIDVLQAKSANLVVEIGCQLRQHPVLRALHEAIHSGKDGKILAFQAWVGQRLDQWRPGTDYRICYSADKERGGGALFDLVHEIDLMTWLAGPMETVYADLRQNSDLEMKAEDLANLVLVSQTGAAGTVQLDMLSPAYRRGLQIVCEKAVYKCDLAEGKLWRLVGASEAECIAQTPPHYQLSQMLYDALENFIARVETPSLAPHCSLKEGIHDLDILLAARLSAANGSRQAIEKAT